MEGCPFKVGDKVVYAPTSRGRDLLVMTDLAALQPCEIYSVSEVVDHDYVVLQDFENAIPSAIHWTEFKMYKPDDCLLAKGKKGKS